MKLEPDIELTGRELELLGKISFDWQNQNELRASIMPMVALAEMLLKRKAIPDIRLLYFTDAERNPSGRGRSREQIFESNGSVGDEIIAHPSFLPYLKYFVYGPNLPADTIRTFKEATSCSGRLTGSDVLDLISTAKAVVRSLQLEPHSAAEEFFKLALECGAMPSSKSPWGQIFYIDKKAKESDKWFMSRPLRIEYPGVVYHVTRRGNERSAIFRDDRGNI